MGDWRLVFTPATASLTVTGLSNGWRMYGK